MSVRRTEPRRTGRTRMKVEQTPTGGRVSGEMEELRGHLAWMRRQVKLNSATLHCILLGAEMRKPALASDGYVYDLKALQAHIKANLDRAILSPTTKQQILPICTYIDCSGKDRRRWGMVKWAPEYKLPAGSQALSTFKQEKVEAVEDSYFEFLFRQAAPTTLPASRSRASTT